MRAPTPGRKVMRVSIVRLLGRHHAWVRCLLLSGVVAHEADGPLVTAL